MTSEKEESAASGETSPASPPADAQGSASASPPPASPAADGAAAAAPPAATAAAAAAAPAGDAVEQTASKEAVKPVAEGEQQAVEEAQVADGKEAKDGKAADGKEAKDGKAAGDAAATTAAAAPAQRTVKSVVLTGYGGIEKMKVKSWPIPNAPAAGQVEVAVSHCGVNYADVCMRRGVQRERSVPYVLGLECAGTVTAVGDDVDTIQPGDRVVCYQHTGDLYRETVVVPVSNVFILPEGMSLEHAAALTVDYLTAYFCLMDFANLRPGQSVLINSCAEGVGWAATQLAKTVEDVVIFGAAAASKHDAVKENGVTHPLNIESVEQELHTISPQGVDIVIDSSTGSNVSANLRLLKPLGRLIIIGTSSVVTGHQKPGFMDMLRNLWSVKTLSTMDLVMGNRSVAGFHLGKIFEQMPERFKQVLEYVFNLYAQERIRPRIDSEVPIEQVVDAAKRLAERENVGKVLLKINAEIKNAEE